MNDNLPELRDIHLPTDTNFIFPIANGWFVMLGVVLCLIMLIYFVVIIRRKSKKIYALKLLSGLNIAQPSSVVKMSEILRRICIYKYPQAAVLINKEWIQFLNEHCQQKLENKSAQILLNAPYINPQKFSADDIFLKEIRDFCVKWIGENL